MSYSVLAAVGSGALVGFILGLLGGGGSILATPLLLYAVGVTSPHVAIGTGALAVSINAMAGFLLHALKGHVWWRCSLVFAGIGAIGALAGSGLGKAIDGRALLVFFGLLMLVVGALMLRPKKGTEDQRLTDRTLIAQGPTNLRSADLRPVDLPMCLRTAAVALLAGFASGFFGIGGGFLVVPALIFATGMPTLNAVGTSLLPVAAFGLATAVNYSISGLVDWPLAAMFIGGGFFGGAAGMLLARRLARYKGLLDRLFAALVFLVAIYILYQSAPAISALN